MRIIFTPRAKKRIESIRLYMEENFYLEYGRRFEDKVISTVRHLIDNPDLGLPAFPEIHRPELRKILCEHYDFWIYYRRQKTRCDILSVRSTLMNIDSPRRL